VSGGRDREGPLSFEPEEGGVEPAPERAGAQRPGPPPPPRPRGPYGWVFGFVVLALLTYILVNTIRTGSGRVGIEPGHRLPPFAVPLASSRREGDANVATHSGQGQAGSRPACEVRGRDVVTICQLAEGHPVVLALGTTRDHSCATELDRLERIRSRFPDVSFVAVVAGVGRGDLRDLIRKRGWRFPVGYDRDRAVLARYGIVDCTLTFAYPGRIAYSTTRRRLDDAQLAGAIRALQAAAKRRARPSP
jgi:hypothetical protein